LPRRSEPRAPAAFFSNGIGDRLLSLPTLRALARLYGCRLTLICDDASAPFFQSQLRLSRIVTVARPSSNRRLFDARAAVRAIGDCDLLVSLAPWSSRSLSQFVAELEPDLSIGFAPVFDVELPRDYSKHSADLAFDVARFLDRSLEIEDFAEPLWFDPAVRRRARRLLAPLPPGVRVLCVHPDTAPEKMWPQERLVEAAATFLEQNEDFFVIVVGMNGEAFEGNGSHPRVAGCCGLPLDLSMQLVSVSDLFLGVDSCMLHAADLARVPGVGLFGPTDSHEFGFRFGPHRHVQASSMDEVRVSDVLASMADLRFACGTGAARHDLEDDA
jgi:ADP-heptose:LPS heptosyltransferase